jgi:sulfur carrier protein
MPMQVLLNGEPRDFDDTLAVSSLLSACGLDGRKVAVEVNGEVVPRSRHDARLLAEGDRIEIIQAIGGG